MKLTDRERTLAHVIHELRATLVRLMVEGDDHSRAVAAAADRVADEDLRKFLADPDLRWPRSNPHDLSGRVTVHPRRMRDRRPKGEADAAPRTDADAPADSGDGGSPGRLRGTPRKARPATGSSAPAGDRSTDVGQPERTAIPERPRKAKGG